MIITGGYYREISLFPGDDQLFGSGGRAAASVSKLSREVEFHTYVDSDNYSNIELFAQQNNISLFKHESQNLLSFEYYHGLSTPIIRPTPISKTSNPVINVSGDLVLRFGMLEGEAIVNASTVVYDPQHPHEPAFFDTNGSRAERLAYVLNRSEILSLTGESSVEKAINRLVTTKDIDVVVVKSGSFGALVWEKGRIDKVKAYETPSVWPIGSGDVFAAIFTFFWGDKLLPARLAAEYASKAASLYCADRVISFTEDILFQEPFPFKPLEPVRTPDQCIIYIAGPFFTMGEYWLVNEARNALIGSGYNTFSPIHDVGYGNADQVVQKDIDGLINSNVVLALCDGLDSGTLFEVGYSVSRNIPVVAFTENTTEEAMKMLEGTGCKITSDFTTAIYHTQWLALTK